MLRLQTLKLRSLSRLFPLASRKVTTDAKELTWPLPVDALKDAYGEEVQLFIHCHLRGYDKEGEGKHLNAAFYDQYGAPVTKEASWLEGYHAIERQLIHHYNVCNNDVLDFPLVAGMGGTVHLYKAIHEHDPWNWSGWIPIQRKWLSGSTFFNNRNFLSIRGNEIQNNLWDYHPYDESEGAVVDDAEYTPPSEPTDKYHGGYFFYNNPYGRYLHVISLKSHIPDPVTELCTRYNYIVHPLAYLVNQLNDLPDNGVDAMQWSIVNIAEEKNFHHHSPWGERVHGLEIFNDFTFANSYSPCKLAPTIHNGTLTQGTGEQIIHWFNSYPLEYGEFLLDSALARGVYFHSLTANDAFYQRGIVDITNKDAIQVTKSNSRGAGLVEIHKKYPNATRVHATSNVGRTMESQNAAAETLLKVQDFLQDLSYGDSTVFGYTTLIDTEMNLKRIVFDRKVPGSDLDEAGCVALHYLRNGSFYSSTGVHGIFDYSSKDQYIPYVIQNQPDPKRMCYAIKDDMSMVFTFEKCTQKQADLIWRYSMMVETESETLETVHGYFKLSDSKKTVLDLSKSYDKENVKWLYFNAISPQNPMKRAWFHAIRGPAFGEPRVHEMTLPDLKHRVYSTTPAGGNVIQHLELQPFPCQSGDLDFHFPKFDTQGKDICVYFLQTYPLQQDTTIPGKTDKSFETPPPRIRQSVHGYLQMNPEYQTRLTLNLWDKDTVKDSHVYFYEINANTGQPQNVNPQPHPV